MALREAAEKQLVEGIDQAFIHLTSLRDELRKLRGIEDFGVLEDDALVSCADHFRALNTNLPLTHLIVMILTAQLKDQITQGADE